MENYLENVSKYDIEYVFCKVSMGGEIKSYKKEENFQRYFNSIFMYPEKKKKKFLIHLGILQCDRENKSIWKMLKIKLKFIFYFAWIKVLLLSFYRIFFEKYKKRGSTKIGKDENLFLNFCANSNFFTPHPH